MRRCSWITGIVPLALSLALGASSPLAASTLDLSWDRCAPITSDKTLAPESFLLASLWVTVTGHSQLHKGYEFWISVGEKHPGIAGFSYR